MKAVYIGNNEDFYLGQPLLKKFRIYKFRASTRHYFDVEVKDETVLNGETTLWWGFKNEDFKNTFVVINE